MMIVIFDAALRPCVQAGVKFIILNKPWKSAGTCLFHKSFYYNTPFMKCRLTQKIALLDAKIRYKCIFVTLGNTLLTCNVIGNNIAQLVTLLLTYVVITENSLDLGSVVNLIGFIATFTDSIHSHCFITVQVHSLCPHVLASLLETQRTIARKGSCTLVSKSVISGPLIFKRKP